MAKYGVSRKNIPEKGAGQNRFVSKYVLQVDWARFSSVVGYQNKNTEQHGKTLA